MIDGKGAVSDGFRLPAPSVLNELESGMLHTSSRIALALLLVSSAAAPGWAADKAAVAIQPAPVKAQSAPDSVEARVTELRAKLHITAEQEGAFTAMAEVMRNNHKVYDDLAKERHRTEKDMNAVQDLKSYAQLAQAHADGVKQLAVSFENLYGTLSDTQKKAADAEFRDYRRHMMARPRPAHPVASRTSKNSQ